MTQRERMLLMVLIAVGIFGLLFGSYLAFSTVGGWFQGGRNRIATLQNQLAEKKRLVRQTENARRKIRQWQDRSLPPVPSQAAALYSDWLLERLGERNFAEPKVESGKQKSERDLYTLLSFTVSGKGTLRQVVDLLHDFYKVDHLHRITRLTILPTKEPKQLTLTMTVEALSMLGALETNELAPRPGNRLELARREDYAQAILGRNLFGPPNQSPQISGLGSQRGTTRTLFTATPTVQDDPQDKHTFKLEKSASPEAELDPETGRFRFTPRETGTYEFVISATDDGIPAKTSTEKLVLTVGNAPPPPSDTRPSFDEARFTILSGVIDNSGREEIWLYNRPRNELLKLRVGDEFEVGSVKGVVKSIGLSDFVFESDGKMKKLDSGDTLANAEIEPQ